MPDAASSTFSIAFAGGSGANIHGDLHNRNVHQNPGLGIHLAQEQLHEELVEHNGLRRGCLRVSNATTDTQMLTVTSEAYVSLVVLVQCLTFSSCHAAGRGAEGGKIC
jgi:hypothetical protein